MSIQILTLFILWSCEKVNLECNSLQRVVSVHDHKRIGYANIL